MSEERTVSSRRAFEGRLISLRVDEIETDEGRRSTREVVEHPGAVVILPWDDERLTVVRQWRHAAGQELLELPAGTIDPGESPLETARRELAEETSLHAGTWDEGPRFFSAPGFCTERLDLFLATELRPAEDVQRPTDESIEISHLDLPAALAAIDDGTIQDAKSIVGILWLARRLGGAP